MLVDPASTPVFGCATVAVVVDFAVCSHLLLNTGIHTTLKSATTFPEEAPAVHDITLIPPNDSSSAVPLPHGCRHIIGADGVSD